MGPINVKAALCDTQTTFIGMPDIQARVGFDLGDRIDLGASVVVGKTDVDPDGPGPLVPDGREEDIFGLSVDVIAKLSDKLAIKGEWYTGKNLADYMGNIGVAIPNNAEIGGDGLWVAVVINPTDALTVNAGVALDSNDEGDIGNNVRADNSVIFGNAIFHINEKTDVGIEISSWDTEYKADTTEYDNLRVQGSVIVHF
jgi:hypothetical protein